MGWVTQGGLFVLQNVLKVQGWVTRMGVFVLLKCAKVGGLGWVCLYLKVQGYVLHTDHSHHGESYIAHIPPPS